MLLSLGWYALRNRETPTSNPSLPALSDSIRFSFEKVTTGYPNTVIFRYDVGNTPYDSLTLQQSWDTSKRIVLTEPQGLVTTTYYYPGYFLTKLSSRRSNCSGERPLHSDPGLAGFNS